MVLGSLDRDLEEHERKKLFTLAVKNHKTIQEDSGLTSLLQEFYDDLSVDSSSLLGFGITKLGNKNGVMSGEKAAMKPVTIENECPYFLPNELCLLDGRICPYSTESYPKCTRYKAGTAAKVPGLDGEVPPLRPETAADDDFSGDETP